MLLLLLLPALALLTCPCLTWSCRQQLLTVTVVVA
jgi:hypothetical protein